MNLKKTHLIPLAIILLYIMFSLYRLADIPPVWSDEIIHLNTTQNLVEEGALRCDFYSVRFKGSSYFQMPLQWLLLSAYIKFFGVNLFGARLLYLFYSVIILLGVYILSKMMLGKRQAVYSLLFLASSYIFFINSRMLLPLVPATAFCVFAILLFYKAVEKNKISLFAVSGFLSGFAYLCHPTGLGIFLIITFLFFYKRISLRYLMTYLISSALSVLPYAIYVFSDFTGYLYQTKVELSDPRYTRSIFLNIVDEIPRRYLGLFPIRGLVNTVKKFVWIFKNLNLKLYACEITGRIFFPISLIYVGLKRHKSNSQKELFLITAVYASLLAVHPNKITLYLYIISPFFVMCLAILANDLIYRKKVFLFGILITLMFIGSNALYIFKNLSSKKITPYSTFINKEVMKYIPKGSRIAAPKYFWLGLQKDFHIVSADQIIDETNRIFEEKGINVGIEELPWSEQENIIKTVLDKYKIEYVLLTCHNWWEITDVPPPLLMQFNNPFRRYLFYNAEKKADFLRVNYYEGMAEAKNVENEVYFPSDGFHNVSTEYQNSLKIYKLK